MGYSNINFDFKNNIVLVIGGSRGIGRGVVDSFLKTGSRVFYASRHPMKNAESNDAVHIPVDLTKEAEIKKLFEVIDTYGTLDILVNSAAINFSKKNENISSEEWNLVIQTNLSAAFYLCKEALARMKKKKRGKIVNISSIAGRHRSLVSGVHYVSSKAGLIGLTKQLAFEAAEYNININALCPSQTMTDMLQKSMTRGEIKNLITSIPLNRLASVEDQVGVILFLCSDAASYITGTYIDVNGGQI